MGHLWRHGWECEKKFLTAVFWRFRASMFHGFSWGLFGAPLAAWYVIFCRDIEHFEGLSICIIWGILEGCFFLLDGCYDFCGHFGFVHGVDMDAVYLVLF